jgi:hypothetical protein
MRVVSVFGDLMQEVDDLYPPATKFLTVCLRARV